MLVVKSSSSCLFKFCMERSTHANEAGPERGVPSVNPTEEEEEEEEEEGEAGVVV